MKSKSHLCFLLFAAFAAFVPVEAKIIRVNNTIPVNEPSQNLYKGFNDAYLAAVGGDTLSVEGSAAKYTNESNYIVSIKKRLVILGPGYLLDKNPQTQATNLSAIIGFRMDFDNGSAGSYVAGLYFDFYDLYIRESNIMVTRNYLEGGVYLENRYDGSKYYGISGIRITHNFMTDGINAFFTSNQGFSDVDVKNNIIYGYVYEPSSSSNQLVFGNVENNTFYYNSNLTFALSAVTFKNNVLALGTAPTFAIDCQAISHNLVNSDRLGTANNNKIYSVNEGTLFAGNVDDFEYDADNEFRIINTRYNTMGSDGKEPGAFGGANPYVLSGLPQIPAIYELSTTGTGSAAGGLPVTIKVKSN